MIQRDQIHGDIEFSKSEMKLITTNTFERLRYIKQLAFAEYVYSGASHNRFQHSLGVCQCVTDMYNAICRNNPNFYREGDLELLRMMALVHDLGHSPFSHASEELSSISHEERLKSILELEKKNIILASDYDIEAWELITQVYLGEGFIYSSDKHLMALHNLMDWFIDADKLDYIERDAINCGVDYGRFDREGLINNLTVIKDEKGNEHIAVKQEGIQALEGFILARYYMFNQVYMHPNERLLRYLYINEMKHILPDGQYPDDIKKFLQLDDTKFARKLKFLNNPDFQLVYDGEFDKEVKQRIDKKLGDLLICDTPRKQIFRRDNGDETIYIVNSTTGLIAPCTDVSPILKSIEFSFIHKLRYYTENSIAQELNNEIKNIVKRA